MGKALLCWVVLNDCTHYAASTVPFMSLSRPSTAFDSAVPAESFFERERDRLVEDISSVSMTLFPFPSSSFTANWRRHLAGYGAA